MEISRVGGHKLGAAPSQRPDGVFAELFERIKGAAIVPHIERWNRIEGRLEIAERRMTRDARAFIDLQLLMQRVGAEAQLTAAVGEAICGVIKRVPQLAGSG